MQDVGNREVVSKGSPDQCKSRRRHSNEARNAGPACCFRQPLRSKPAPAAPRIAEGRELTQSDSARDQRIGAESESEQKSVTAKGWHHRFSGLTADRTCHAYWQVPSPHFLLSQSSDRLLPWLENSSRPVTRSISLARITQTDHANGDPAALRKQVAASAHCPALRLSAGPQAIPQTCKYLAGNPVAPCPLVQPPTDKATSFCPGPGLHTLRPHKKRWQSWTPKYCWSMTILFRQVRVRRSFPAPVWWFTWPRAREAPCLCCRTRASARAWACL